MTKQVKEFAVVGKDESIEVDGLVTLKDAKRMAADSAVSDLWDGDGTKDDESYQYMIYQVRKIATVKAKVVIMQEGQKNGG